MSTITVLFLQSVKLYTFVRIVYLVTLFCQTITLLHKQAKKVNRIEINDNRELKTCNKKSDNINWYSLLDFMSLVSINESTLFIFRIYS